MSTQFEEENKLWSSIDTPFIFNSKISLGHAILWSLERNNSKILQINHETNIQLTSRFMRRQTIRAAMNLQNLDYRQGDIIGIVAKNSHFVAPIVYASMCIGCPLSALDPSFSKPELLHMLAITKPKLMFADVNMYDLLQECLQELGNDAHIFTFGGQSGRSIPVKTLFEETSGESAFMPVELDGENTTAVIVCTSGTTGLSKGVCLSHANLLHQAAEVLSREDDVVLTFSTIYWISGVIVLLAGAIKGYQRIITTDTFSPELFLEMISEHRVTSCLSASHSLVLTVRSDRFYETDISSIRLIMSAGSKLAPSVALEIKKKLKKGSSIVQIYGMSEAAGGITAMEFDSEHSTSVGQVLYGAKIKIIDNDANRLGVEEMGEICVKTKFKFLGYYANEEATNGSVDHEGYLMTGDIGYFDGDGNLHLVDRKKDMLKYCGSQISPTEIEQHLIQSPSIKAACVIGIPDPVVNDLPAAVIIRNDNDPKISRYEVEQMIAVHFADYKRLRGGVYFVDSFPTTPSGKVLRRKVKEIATDLFNARQQ